MVRPVSIEIVEDRTAVSRCDDGFLRLKRLVVRTRYADGSASDPYPCDIVSRPDPDAVATVLYRRGHDRKVEVVLKEGVRPPVYLRKLKKRVQPDAAPSPTLIELAAGVLEPEDGGLQGIGRRAAAEVREETGFDLPLSRFRELGSPLFASPGTSDEKVFFCEAELTDEEGGGHSPGDGSTMEQGTRVVVIELGEAIRMCRDGRIRDMKTEVALLRLAERVGYIPHAARYEKP